MTTDYDEGKFKQLLATLNQTYDTFKKKYGYINQAVNARVFDRDDRYPLIASLELEELDENDSSKVVFVKSDAFQKPTIRPKKTPPSSDVSSRSLECVAFRRSWR